MCIHIAYIYLYMNIYISGREVIKKSAFPISFSLSTAFR